jgi:predicted nucleic acid-binding protein
VNALLIDTNIYSHALRGDESVTSVLQGASRIGLSSISVGELLSGFKGGSNEKVNRDELAQFLDSPRVEVHAVTENTAEFYAAILDNLRKAGTPIPTNDIWIAAVAQEHGLRLYSLDRHLAAIPGLLLLSGD